MPGTSSPDPAAISVTAGSAAVASTEPEPPPFQNSQIGDPGQRLGDLAASHLELGHGCLLEAAHQEGLGALVRYVVGHARDLPLVGHHADQAEAVALDDPAGQGDDVGGVEEGGALGPDVLPADPQSCVEVEGDPDLHVVGVADCVDSVEVGRVVDHQGDGGGCGR
jgi:hypothetical protein